MPRPARLLLSQSFYHVMTRGNNKNQVFKTGSNYLYYLQLVKKYKKDLPFDLYHYCLMPNHIHMLIKTKRADNFSLFMKKLNLAYFHYYRKNYGWTGHFWQDRFKSQPVGKDEYFIQCGKYIELNPVRANITDKPESYPYSSYKYYSVGEENDLITQDIIYTGLGNARSKRQERYRKIIVDDIVIINYKTKVWGSNNQKYKETRKISHYFQGKNH